MKSSEADLLNAPVIERAEPLVFSEMDESAVSDSTSAIEACPVAVPTVKAKKKIKR
jgi:ferredoxin